MKWKWSAAGFASLVLAITATEYAGFNHSTVMMVGFWALGGVGYCIAKVTA